MDKQGSMDSNKLRRLNSNFKRSANLNDVSEKIINPSLNKPRNSGSLQIDIQGFKKQQSCFSGGSFAVKNRFSKQKCQEEAEADQDNDASNNSEEQKVGSSQLSNHDNSKQGESAFINMSGINYKSEYVNSQSKEDLYILRNQLSNNNALKRESNNENGDNVSSKLSISNMIKKASFFKRDSLSSISSESENNNHEENKFNYKLPLQNVIEEENYSESKEEKKIDVIPIKIQIPNGPINCMKEKSAHIPIQDKSMSQQSQSVGVPAQNDQDSDNSQIPDDEGSHVQMIYKIEAIDFHSQVSNMSFNKGNPVANQVTPFSQAQSQKEWELPGPSFDNPQQAAEASYLQKSHKLELERHYSQHKRLFQSQIFSMINNISEVLDKVDMKKQDFKSDVNKAYIEEEEIKFQEQLKQRREQNQMKLLLKHSQELEAQISDNSNSKSSVSPLMRSIEQQIMAINNNFIQDQKQKSREFPDPNSQDSLKVQTNEPLKKSSGSNSGKILSLQSSGSKLVFNQDLTSQRERMRKLQDVAHEINQSINLCQEKGIIPGPDINDQLVSIKKLNKNILRRSLQSFQGHLKIIEMNKKQIENNISSRDLQDQHNQGIKELENQIFEILDAHKIINQEVSAGHSEIKKIVEKSDKGSSIFSLVLGQSIKDGSSSRRQSISNSSDDQRFRMLEGFRKQPNQIQYEPIIEEESKQEVDNSQSIKLHKSRSQSNISYTNSHSASNYDQKSQQKSNISNKQLKKKKQQKLKCINNQSYLDIGNRIVHLDSSLEKKVHLSEKKSDESINLSEEEEKEALDEIQRKKQAIIELLEEEVIQNRQDPKAASDGASMFAGKNPLQHKNSYFSQNSMSSCDGNDFGVLQQLEEIKKSVQMGGNLCLQRFDSFGQSNNPSQNSNTEQIGAKSSIDSGKFIMNALELQEGNKVQQKKNSSQSLVNAQSSKSSVRMRPLANNDNQAHHSALSRQIEQRLKEMMIDYNPGIIIQMSLNEKIKLKQQIDNVREQNVIKKDKTRKSQSEKSPSEFSANDRQRKNKKKKKKVKQLKNNQAEEKVDDQNLDYDFYLQNHQGMFVVNAQECYRNLLKLLKKKDIKNQLTGFSNMEEMKIELQQDRIFNQMTTLCFDIESTFLRKVNINDHEELNLMTSLGVEKFVLVHTDKSSYSQSKKLIKNFYSKIADKTMRCLQYNQDQMKELINVYKQNIGDIEEYNSPKLNRSQSEKSFKDQYIVSQNNGASGGSFLDENQRDCCSIGIQGLPCVCKMEIYQIRPYSLEILRAIQPFFEVIASTNKPFFILQQIIDQIEAILNKPILEKIMQKQDEQKSMHSSMGSKSDESLKGGRKRRERKIEPKTFFHFIICDNNFTFVEEANAHIENLFLLTGNRKQGNIFLVSGNHFNLMLAKDSGFCILPIVPFVMSNQEDAQLKMVENYLLKLRYVADNKSKNDIDFGFLTIKNRFKKSKLSIEQSALSSLSQLDQSNVSANIKKFSSGNLSFGEQDQDNSEVNSARSKKQEEKSNISQNSLAQESNYLRERIKSFNTILEDENENDESMQQKQYQSSKNLQNVINQNQEESKVSEDGKLVSSSNSTNKLSLQGQRSIKGLKQVSSHDSSQNNSSSIEYQNLAIEKMTEGQLVEVIKKTEASILKKAKNFQLSQQ